MPGKPMTSSELHDTGVFGAPDFDRHERILFWHDADQGVRAIVALHRVRHGRALGGCRVAAYPNEAAALSDVLRLSRGMSYKTALAGLPCGGAKAVLIGDPRTVKTQAALRSLGRMVESLGGVYVTAEDVGMAADDVAVIRRETRWALGTSPEIGTSGPHTAAGVFAAMRAVLEHQRNSSSFAGITVAVQGAGSVGSRLCELLHQAGAQLIVADADAERAQRVAESTAAAVVRPEAIHSQRADIFAPCALGAVLNARTIPELGARIVAGAANNQLATPADGDRLHARGILYVADYLASAGGVISGMHELEGRGRAGLDERIASIGKTATEVLSEAQRLGVTAATAADIVAERRLSQTPRGASANPKASR